MNERVYHNHADRLRSKERLEMLDLDLVVALTKENLEAASLLDVGTGSALFAEAFFNSGLVVAGVDINQVMIDVAVKQLPHTMFKTGAAEKLPFEDKTFDIVFFGHVLHEADDLVLALKEALRVAKRRIVILEWPYREEPMGPPIGHRLSPKQILKAAEDAGISGKVEVLQMKHMVMCRVDVE